MFCQECMPAQQISPSAASRSPWSSATLAASRNVSAILFVLPCGSAAQCVGLSAESMRMTPYFRTPCSLSIVGDAAGLFHGDDELLRGPRRCPSPSRRPCPARPARRASRRRAPWRRSCRPCAASRRRWRRIGVRMEQEQIDAFELLAVDIGGGRQFEHPVEADRRMVGARPLCRRGRATWRCEVWGTLLGMDCFVVQLRFDRSQRHCDPMPD